MNKKILTSRGWGTLYKKVFSRDKVLIINASLEEIMRKYIYGSNQQQPCRLF